MFELFWVRIIDFVSIYDVILVNKIFNILFVYDIFVRLKNIVVYISKWKIYLLGLERFEVIFIWFDNFFCKFFMFFWVRCSLYL